jgi:hypothetical protein
MDIPVIVEPVAGNGYRAVGTAGLSIGLIADGKTPEEAMEKLGDLVKARAAKGAEMRTLAIPAGPHPFSRFAGSLRDEPLFEAWKQAMEEYRRRLDEDPDAL